jgi:hypothetical protein
LGLDLDDSEQIRAQQYQCQQAEHALGEIRRELDAARKLKAGAQEDALERLRLWWDDPKAPTFVWHFDFAEVFHRVPHRESPTGLLDEGNETVSSSLNGFDEIIGNPPYIRIQALNRIAPEDVEWYREHYRAAKKGNYDLYVVFIERGLKLLHDRGQLAFICPHKFFNAQYGQPLRDLIAQGRNLRHVVHFGDQQIFPGATNYVCLLFLARAGVESCRFVRADALPIWLATKQGTEGVILLSKIAPGPWNFVVGKNASLFEQLEAVEVRLVDATERIFQGIKTSGDKVYIVEELSRQDGVVRAYSRQTELEHDLDEGLLHPLVKGGDSRAFALETTTLRILFRYAANKEGRVSLIPEDVLKKRYRVTWQ